MTWTTRVGALLTCAVAIATSLTAGAPPARAWNGDIHIIGQGVVQTLDCNNTTLLINGSQNVITAQGTCYAVTTQGSSNIVIADTVVNDITVYGFDQTVYYHNGDPNLVDVGRELGMTNRILRVPA